jgi:uncharacterized surface protein with fasciclin (FAS1) repeats
VELDRAEMLLEKKQMGEALNIIDTAIRSGTFQTFTRLLEGSSLERVLRCGVSYTLFAPADIAFAYIPSETLNQLLKAESLGILADVLSYHAVPGKILVSQLKYLSRARTVCGEDLIISNAHELRIEGARLLKTDIEARNGVIHAIDRLLLPVKAAAAAHS